MNAPTPNRDREKAKVDRLRDIADRLAGDVWHVDADGDRVRLVTRRSTGEDALLLTLHGDALQDEVDLITGALDHLFLFLGLRSRAVETVQSLRAEIERMRRKTAEKDYAAQASMLLSDRGFQRFLESRGAGGQVRDKTAADTRLKSLLAIRSKREINTDDRARQAFLQLRGDYDLWKRGGP
ncbi:hypothetical protein [Rhizobium sp. IMFF44]|uniref:hypothetical protein n=1 Tax=Rhizobium sp. IMFF44 TaxID=3342350 RepID=UPI0035BADCFA